MEFIFEDIIYKYEDGTLYYKDSWGCFIYFCPVLRELNEIMDTFDNSQRIAILEAIVHGCCYGYRDGKKAKVAEIKRALEIY